MDVDDGTDSLFGSDTSHDASALQYVDLNVPVASRLAPSIPGMFFFPDLLSRQLHDQVLNQVSKCGYFSLENDEMSPSQLDQHDLSLEKAYHRSPRNQAMLFARSLPPLGTNEDRNDTSLETDSKRDDISAGCFGLPAWAVELILYLRQLLTSLPNEQLDQNTKHLLFPVNQLLSRQLILNLYNGPQGLASHVDLVHRFADGILLCSFGPQGTGTVMDFTHPTKAPHHLFLPSGSVLLLSREARYEWSHGISARPSDLVRSAECPEKVETVHRSIRLSITIRSMLPGADVVGQ
ncbi:uncharacterized protein UTRI_05600 [Ustilago trichophora]|uniref:Fe2OG dioxygenase domain-containing protein n=1 Tax=Ustilago trichophora TaxID=86804 RepID=A0A5C3EHD7_9BASI|nr:uncharacterized protein UTRI_05600 [Ustilago trichophora]